MEKDKKDRCCTLEILAEFYDWIGEKHLHRSTEKVEYKEVILGKKEKEKSGILNEIEKGKDDWEDDWENWKTWRTWKEKIRNELNNNNWDNAISLLNYLFMYPNLKEGDKISQFLRKCQENLEKWYKLGVNPEGIDDENVFFNVLVVDDFFLFHLKEFIDLERQISGEASDGNVAPIIHFDFECCLSSVKKRLNKKGYHLIILDLDFGEQINDNYSPKKIVDEVRKKDIPVIVYSKYDKINEYKDIIGGVQEIICKDKSEDSSCKILKVLKDYYNLEIYKYNNWLSIKSPKLLRFGFYYNIKGIQDIEECVDRFFGEQLIESHIEELWKKCKEENKKGKNFLFVPLIVDNRLQLIVAGGIPSFIENSKYMPALIERLNEYGVKYEKFETKTKSSGSDKFEFIIIYLTQELEFSESLAFGEKTKKKKRFEYLRQALRGIELDLNYIVVPSFSSLSLLDIVGPVMIGPSSSHTAGANRMARLARNFAEAICSKVKWENVIQIVVHMLNSFYDTGEGHGSHKAIAAGLAGLKQSDVRLPKSLINPGRDKENIINSKELNTPENGHIKINDKVKVDFYWDRDYDPDIHNNSVRFHIINNPNNKWEKDSDKKPDGNFKITMRSIGGGNIQISDIDANGKEVKINDKYEISTKDGKDKFSQELEKDKTLLSGKEKIKVKINGEDLEIVPIFGIYNLEETEDGDTENQIIVAECPVLELDKTFENEKWLKGERIDKNGKEKLKRPDFLNLDDLIELQKKIPNYKDPVRIAIDYEKWVRGQEGFKIEDEFVVGTFKEYRKLMLRAAKKGISSLYEDRKSFTDYRLSKAYDLYSTRSGIVTGDISYRAAIYAMGVNELNVKMSCPIAAAPTAGSCGILPGVLKAIDDSLERKGIEEGIREDKETGGLIVAALIGLIINNLVPTAGAEYGCQAEIGTGAAMAAAMAAYILGGTLEDSVHASAITLKDSLGLVCDPLEGKVEIPCIKRSALKASEAIQSAFMALNGIRSEVSPSDVIRAMKEIGDNMLRIYKETSKGGLALTRRSRVCVG